MDIAYLPRYKTAITGYKGYLGSSLLQLLPQDEIEIKTLDSISTIETILHFAARVTNTIETFLNNTQLDVAIFEFCKSHNCKIIYASTNNVYGQELQCPEKSIYDYSDYYSASKITGEQLLRHFYHIPYVLLRIGDVFGVAQKHGNFFKAIADSIKNKKPLTQIGDGAKVRSHIYAPDVANMAFFFIQNNGLITNQIVNVAYKEIMSLAQILKRFSDQYHIPLNQLPGNQANEHFLSVPDMRTMTFNEPQGFHYQFNLITALDDYYHIVHNQTLESAVA